MESENEEIMQQLSDSKQQDQYHQEYQYQQEYLNEQHQYGEQEENQEEELSSMSSFQPDRQVGPEKDENKEEAEQIINSALGDADSQNNYKQASQLKSVKFHVKDCEETFQKIESIMNVNREQFMHGKASISPSKTGVSLSFFVKPQYYELIWPLQELITIQEQIQSVQPDSPIVPKAKQNNQTVKPITFLIDNVERFLSQIENTLNIQRSAFMQGKPDIKKQSTGKHILQIFTPPQYYDRIYQTFSNYLHISNKTKKNQSIPNNQSQESVLKNIGGTQNQPKLIKSLQKPCVAETKSKPKQKKPVKTDQPKFVQVKFHVHDCEETLKSIEQILCVPRERFLHGKLGMTPMKQGQLLQFFVKPEYQKLIQPLQTQLSFNIQQKTHNEVQNNQKIQIPNQNKHTQPELVPVQVKFHVHDCEETLKSIEQILCVPRERFLHGKISVGKMNPGYVLLFFVKPDFVEQVKLLQESLSFKIEQIVVKVDNAQEVMKKLETYLNLKQEQFCSKVNIISRKKMPQELTINLISEYKIQAEQFLNSISIKEPIQQAKECKNLNQQSQSAISTSQSNVAVENQSNTMQNTNKNQQANPINNEEVLNLSSSESFDIEISDSNEQTTQQNAQIKQDQNEDSDSEIEFNISDSELSENEQNKEKIIQEKLVELPPHQTIVVPDVEKFITELETVLGVERNQILTAVQDTVLSNGTHHITIQINAENKKNVEQAIAKMNRE
ncbi:Hypothetical_protein [Hexamita inflata]|uniref:Hypothetical_protein n=1 Tax=Hexamita inflata TaxID=28002 RepID=A0AA86PUW8_9EUKA|nr:Hypothetical protein HINF_LOCUS32921 [Hexamita inflata]